MVFKLKLGKIKILKMSFNIKIKIIYNLFNQKDLK